jgi:hypothetical protein
MVYHGREKGRKRRKKIEERKKEEDIIDLIGSKKMEGKKITFLYRRF